MLRIMTLTAEQKQERQEAIDLRRYEDYEVKEVVTYKDSGHISVTTTSSTCFGWHDETPPKAGDTVRLYGGFGYVIEGADLNGEPVWFDTKAERDSAHRQMVEDIKTKKLASFEANKEGLDADFDALPDNFRARIQRFRDADVNFRWESESYEMFPLSRAVALLEHLEQDGMYEKLHEVGAKVPKSLTLEGGRVVEREYDMVPEDMSDAWEDTLENRVLAWHYLGTKPMGYNSKAQAEVVPDEVSGNASHSGNTYGAMIAFARRQAAEPGFTC